MNRIWFIVFALVCGCSNDKGKQQISGKADTTIVAKDSIQPPPDISFLRKRLLDYFERHRHLDSFDTTDYSYASYNGPFYFAPYNVTAGNLLSPKHLHATVFYVDDSGLRLQIYIKERGNWVNIFDDSSFSYASGASYPYFEDWNSDGIKDLVISQYALMDKIDNYELWLADRSGKRFHYIKDFVELSNPELDTLTGEIHTGHYNAGGMHMGKWRFRKYSLENIYEVHIGGMCYETASPDSAVVIGISKNGGKFKAIWCAEEDAHKHVPADLREEVKEAFR